MWVASVLDDADLLVGDSQASGKLLYLVVCTLKRQSQLLVLQRQLRSLLLRVHSDWSTLEVPLGLRV